MTQSVKKSNIANQNDITEVIDDKLIIFKQTLEHFLLLKCLN